MSQNTKLNGVGITPEQYAIYCSTGGGIGISNGVAGSTL